MSREIRVLPTLDALMLAAADAIVADAARAIDETGRFVLALSGGSTPRRLYALLAGPTYAARIAWDRVEVCFGDERCVPPDDAASNYRMAQETLLAHVPVEPSRVHRIHGEDAPASAASAYEHTLRAVLATPRGAPQPVAGRRIDLALLGMGDNGHTLSLFPGSPTVHERGHWAVPDTVDATPPTRVTLTAPIVNAAAHALFLVAGADKAPMLRRVLEGPHDPDALPAQLIAPTDGRLTWLVDAAAAAELTRMT
ncbi:MAG TPA: 6-phosphogluconolactonase [Candidatus Binatia bacterium]